MFPYQMVFLDDVDFFRSRKAAFCAYKEFCYEIMYPQFPQIGRSVCSVKGNNDFMEAACNINHIFRTGMHL
jgi:hypothetical protein